jgi:hypothetical protein
MVILKDYEMSGLFLLLTVAAYLITAVSAVVCVCLWLGELTGRPRERLSQPEAKQ